MTYNFDEMNDVELLEFWTNKKDETQMKLDKFLATTKRKNANIFVLSSRNTIKRCEEKIKELEGR